MLGEVTRRQYEVLCFLVEFFKNKTHYPTHKEIGNKLSIKSTNGVNYHLKRLEKKGWIVLELHNKRGMYLTRQAREEFGLLFEYELRRMGKNELYRWLGEPISKGRRYCKIDKGIHVSKSRFGGVSSLPIDF